MYCLTNYVPHPEGKQVNWDRVAELSCFGGIRIEDNLHITTSGNENLTRDAFFYAELNPQPVDKF